MSADKQVNIWHKEGQSVGETGTKEFPKGFVYGARLEFIPKDFVESRNLANLYLHPELLVDAKRDASGSFVVVLGECVSILSRDSKQSPAEALLAALLWSKDQFLKELDNYSGRHAVIFGSQDHPMVVTDATGMRSVFYDENFGSFSSHAFIVARQRTLIQESDLPFRFGYPGNRTPFDGVRLLIPNNYLDVAQGGVRRFYPRAEIDARSVSTAAEETSFYASNALAQVAARRPLRLALTAGLDSRVMLSLLASEGVEFETFTYGNRDDTLVDRKVAAALSAQVGVVHSELTKPLRDTQIQSALDQAHYKSLHQRWVPTLKSWFGDANTTCVTANLLEIGRSFYGRYRRSKVQRPTNSVAMWNLHRMSMGKSARSALLEFGRSRADEIGVSAFEGFLRDTDYESSLGYLDSFDQFYWEHRMGSWHGPAMVERDFYSETFIPFNSRKIFEVMLGVEIEKRDSGDMFTAMINSSSPHLLEIPINPTQWP